MRLTIMLTTDREDAAFAIGVNTGLNVYWLGFCGLWEVIEPGVPWWRPLFDNREPGRGGALYGLVRWTFSAP
jgi:hypothetical protein